MSAVEPIDVRVMTRSERDALIVKLRGEGRKLSEIAKLTGVTEQRVSQIVAREKSRARTHE
jgi:DNA-directed RNA polymerase specialized sigma subunit